MCRSDQFYMPAEWEKHECTYIAWPNLTGVWSDHHLLMSMIFSEYTRVLSQYEKIHVLCYEHGLIQILTNLFASVDVELANVSFHVVPHSYCWLRDAAPTGVLQQDGRLSWMAWERENSDSAENGNSKSIPDSIAQISDKQLLRSLRSDNQSHFHLEGGAFDTDGLGTLLVTEQCLLSPGRSAAARLEKAEYEQLFRKYLGAEKVIWLKNGCCGDKTGGHVDNVARFVAPGKVVAALEEDPRDDNYRLLAENFEILSGERDAAGHRFEVIPLPMPKPVNFLRERLPASYANFYIANGLVAVPTFNDPQDYRVLSIFRSLFPDRDVLGVYSREIVIAGGTLHCLTQQQPCELAVQSAEVMPAKIETRRA